jgi:hypothetical protein
VVAALQARLDDQVVIFSAPGNSRECVEIVRRVLALASDGVAFDRIAVLLRSPQEYRSYLEHSGVPMCQSTLRAVRSARIRRGVHFMHCSAVPLKICQRGGF